MCFKRRIRSIFALCALGNSKMVHPTDTGVVLVPRWDDVAHRYEAVAVRVRVFGNALAQGLAVGTRTNGSEDALIAKVNHKNHKNHKNALLAKMNRKSHKNHRIHKNALLASVKNKNHKSDTNHVDARPPCNIRT